MRGVDGMYKVRTKEFYNKPDEIRWGREKMPDMEVLLKQIASCYKISDNDFIVELGCGRGALKDCLKNYVGIDISFTALKKYLNNKYAIQADMQNLPIKDESVSFVITVAALEHVSKPEDCLSEIDRILKYNGICILAPSWFVRPWSAKGLLVKKYSELSVKDKIGKFLIPLRNHIIWRSLFIIPARIIREINFFLSGKPMPFLYKRLSPNLEDYICSDSDAFCSLDPHMAIMYFYSRNYEVFRSSFLKRIFYRHRPIAVRKINENSDNRKYGRVGLDLKLGQSF